jgi:autoinducer 2-degrading protein
MYTVTLITLRIKPDCVAAFKAAIEKNHAASVLEPGNLRFDVLQDPDDPTRFVLYEAYVSAAAAVAHRETRHFLDYRAATAELFAEPRQAVIYQGLFPLPAET